MPYAIVEQFDSATKRLENGQQPEALIYTSLSAYPNCIDTNLIKPIDTEHHYYPFAGSMAAGGLTATVSQQQQPQQTSQQPVQMLQNNLTNGHSAQVQQPIERLQSTVSSQSVTNSGGSYLLSMSGQQTAIQTSATILPGTGNVVHHQQQIVDNPTAKPTDSQAPPTSSIGIAYTMDGPCLSATSGMLEMNRVEMAAGSASSAVGSNERTVVCGGDMHQIATASVVVGSVLSANSNIPRSVITIANGSSSSLPIDTAAAPSPLLPTTTSTTLTTLVSASSGVVAQPSPAHIVANSTSSSSTSPLAAAALALRSSTTSSSAPFSASSCSSVVSSPLADEQHRQHHRREQEQGTQQQHQQESSVDGTRHCSSSHSPPSAVLTVRQENGTVSGKSGGNVAHNGLLVRLVATHLPRRTSPAQQVQHYQSAVSTSEQAVGRTVVVPQHSHQQQQQQHHTRHTHQSSPPPPPCRLPVSDSSSSEQQIAQSHQHHPHHQPRHPPHQSARHPHQQAVAVQSSLSSQAPISLVYSQAPSSSCSSAASALQQQQSGTNPQARAQQSSQIQPTSGNVLLADSQATTQQQQPQPARAALQRPAIVCMIARPDNPSEIPIGTLVSSSHHQEHHQVVHQVASQQTHLIQSQSQQQIVTVASQSHSQILPQNIQSLTPTSTLVLPPPPRQSTIATTTIAPTSVPVSNLLLPTISASHLTTTRAKANCSTIALQPPPQQTTPPVYTHSSHLNSVQNHQIRDYLSEIDISDSVVGISDQCSNLLTMALGATPDSGTHQIIHVDQNGHPIDPSQLNQYVYHLQLAPGATTTTTTTSTVPSSVVVGEKHLQHQQQHHQQQTQQITLQPQQIQTQLPPGVLQAQQQPQQQQTIVQQPGQQTFLTLGPASTVAPSVSSLPVTSTIQPNQTIPIGQQVIQAKKARERKPRNRNGTGGGRGRPKKNLDPLSLAVEQCLDSSQQYTTTTTAPDGTVTVLYHCRAPNCGFISMDVLEFRNHNRSEHRDESTIIPPRKGSKANPNKEVLMCEVPGCGYTPKYRRLLIDHQNAHKGLRAHKCCFCDYNSSYFGDIRKHMMKKHPDLNQEIKVSKAKLKEQMIAEGKTLKSARERKREARAARQAAAAAAAAANPDGVPKKRRRNRKKKNQDTNAVNGSAVSGQDPTKQQTVGVMQQPQVLQQPQGIAASNLQTIQAAQPQAVGHPQQQQYNFVTSQQQYATTTDPSYAQQVAGQTAIIYVTTPSGQTVQLACNDVQTLNQLINGYTDINQLLSAVGAQQATAAPAQPQVQQQAHLQAPTQHQVSLNGTTFAVAPEHAQPTMIYKCNETPYCTFQSPDYEAVILHKHRDHPPQSAATAVQGQQQQQVTIIDSQSLASTGQHVQQQQQQIYTLAAPGGAGGTTTSAGQFTNLDFATLTNPHVTVDTAGNLQNLIFATDQNGQQIFLANPAGSGAPATLQAATAAT